MCSNNVHFYRTGEWARFGPAAILASPSKWTLVPVSILELVIAKSDTVESPFGQVTFDTRTPRQKYDAYNSIYWPLRKAHPDQQAEIAAVLGERHGVDSRVVCSECAVSWEQLGEMLATGLVSIGAHTENHRTLSQLTIEDARAEIIRGCDAIHQCLQIKPRHFAFPYGDSASAAGREFSLADELGFKTAVTTRKGVVYPEHADHLHALPRVSLNGYFQHVSYLRTLMSGVPFALRRGFRRLDVA